MGNSTDQGTYASALLREALKGSIEGSELDAHEWAGVVDGDRMAALNHFQSLWTERSRGDFRETPLGRLLLANGQTVEITDAVREQRVGQMQGAVGLHREQDDARDALYEVVSRLSQEGTIAAIVGPPGAGKTATLLDLARAWGAWTGGRIVSNVGWEGADATVSTDVEMLEAMAAAKGQALGLLDEANKGSLTGRGTDSTKAESFADRMTMIRKDEEKHGPHAKRGSLAYVSHNWKRMNAPSRRMTTLIVQKPSRGDPGKVVLWESPGGEDKRDRIGEYKGLTDTRESYDEWEASAFDVAEEDADEEVEEGPSEDEVRRQEAIAAAVRTYEPWSDDNSMSYGDVARVVDRSETWVGNRIREWREGDHRDLVPEPE